MEDRFIEIYLDSGYIAVTRVREEEEPEDAIRRFFPQFFDESPIIYEDECGEVWTIKVGKEEFIAVLRP